MDGARLAAVLAAALAACGGEPRPNLLLVTVDTLRADRLACYGGAPDVGTAICALADRGTRFDWAFAPAPYTAPSVASILTSRYPRAHGVTQNARSYLGDEELSVAELLRDAGYTTAAFVSNPVIGRHRNLGQGFGVYDDQMTRRERNRPVYREREAEATSDAALAWAQALARPPWFLWVHFQDPHGPYEPPGAPPERDLPGERRLRVLPRAVGLRGIPAYQALPGLFTPGAYERRYGAEIRYLDAHLARLVEGLDALGAPPAVLLTSDHGEAFGEDGVFFSHGHSLGLEQIRVPLLWRPPSPSPARVERTPVSLLDVAPTLLRLASLEIPATFGGRPLPIADDPEARGADGERALFAEHTTQAAVILGRAYYSAMRPQASPTAATQRVLGLPRVARLPRLGPLPDYARPAEDGEDPRLAAALREFLAGAERPALEREVTDELLEQMRALGYAE